MHSIFRLGQRSILRKAARSTQNIPPLCSSQSPFLWRGIRLLYNENDPGPASPSQPSLNDRLNLFNKELTATKSEVTHVRSDMALLRSDMAHLEKNITAQINVLHATLDSRLDKFENRFLFRMLFVAFGVMILAVGSTVTTALMRYQTPPPHTPTVKED